MIYDKWMSYIKDDVKLRDVVIPGSHNTGSYGMNPTACCQDGNLYEQFKYGVRYYCMRLDTKKGKVVQCHGIMKGEPFEDSLKQFKKILEENDSEFLIIDLREYYPQQVGPIKLKYKVDPKKVDELLEEYIQPSKYALTDFDNISNVTMGDIRKAGKRYILINYEEAYQHSVNCQIDAPWDNTTHGFLPQRFLHSIKKYFDKDYDGLFWFQTQQTPNIGSDIGFKTPRKLDKTLRIQFKSLLRSIAADPEKLKKMNIVAGDFMTEDYSKSHEILLLNLFKNNVEESRKDEFRKGLLV